MSASVVVQVASSAFPDARGRFGAYGGQYVPETLMSALAELRRRLGLVKLDPFERARANAERIRAREGNIDVVGLLDAVRGPWE